LQAHKKEKELKAIRELAGLWEDKDTSFFERG
jgi:hypothetical protein